jgi:hypothetical protein
VSSSRVVMIRSGSHEFYSPVLGAFQSMKITAFVRYVILSFGVKSSTVMSG